jgi:membrane dipeptidase
MSLSAGAQAPSELDARARAIHRRILVIDSHTDVLLPSSPENLYAPGHTSHVDLDKLRRGGIGGVAMAIAVGSGPRTAEGIAAAHAEADAKLAAIRAFLRDNPRDAALALSADDILRIHKAGKIAVIESFLNARSIGTDIAAIDGLYRDGVRLFGFTHAGNNDFADSSRPTGEPAEEHHGLSPLGKQAVTRLNRLGVIIDISQLTTAGVMQTLELSKAPVIASHSNVRALVDNSRTLTDLELDAIKVNGGVVDVTPFNNYLRRIPPDLDKQVALVRQQFGLPPTARTGAAGIEDGAQTLPADRAAAYNAQARALLPRATVSDLVDHIDYIVKRIGIEHVGIGTDFNHGSGIQGFDDESEAPNVTRELVRRGYSEDQIARLWGGNFLRVFRRVEETARALGKS